MHKHREDFRPHRLCTAAGLSISGITIHAVFGGIEVSIGKLNDVVVKHAENVVKPIALIRLGHDIMYLAHASQYQTIIRSKFCNRNGIGCRIELTFKLT